VRRQEFAAGVMHRLGRLRAAETVKASRFSEMPWVRTPQVEAPPVGHPAFTSLRVGETATCELAIAFLDMRAMTARSFWEPLQEVTTVSLALLGQVAEVVQESGGHVLGLRGDGLMAGWGNPHSDGDIDVIMSLAACAFSLDAVQNALNGLLELDGIAPVQLCAGADHGEVCFARTGTIDASEVNIVGHPANFAAKCEKVALSWEVVVGEGAAAAIEPQLLTEHEQSPKEYVHAGRRRAYCFYQFAWRQILGEAASAIAQVGGRPTSSIDPNWKEPLR
jgi:adenylate cyclase